MGVDVCAGVHSCSGECAPCIGVDVCAEVHLCSGECACEGVMFVQGYTCVLMSVPVKMWIFVQGIIFVVMCAS